MADEKKSLLDPFRQVLSGGLFIIIMFIVTIILFYLISSKPQ